MITEVEAGRLNEYAKENADSQIITRAMARYRVLEFARKIKEEDQESLEMLAKVEKGLGIGNED